MQIEITRKFQKQVEKCKDQRIKSKIRGIIEGVIAEENMNTFLAQSGIHNVKKLTGYKNSYRIRLGAYRIGLIIEDNSVIFAAFDHRSDIYKYFP